MLGIAKTGDVSAIRRAYAEKLKAMDIDRDVDGYARLRDARDAGLRWARMQAPPVDDALLATDETAPDPAAVNAPKAETSSWLYGAPQAQGTADPTLTMRLGESAQSLDVTPGFAAAQAPAEQAIAVSRDPFTRPVLLGLEPSADAVMPAWAHEQALHRLLLPETDLDELPPLQGWEEAMARGHLKAVLHNAENVSVTAFDEIDNWLAGILRRSWPRSAPLLEPAAQVFGWEGERGQVSERPAVSFLNSRMRGLRFREKVQMPGHPLHKAWVELSTPAQQGSRRGWLVKRSDVEKLIEGVRKNFPELEHHFDPWRVSLWERQGTSSDNYGWLSGWRLAAIAAIFIVQVIRFAMSSNGADPQAIAPPPAIAASDQARESAVIQRAAAEIFGDETSLDRIRAQQPDLAALFAANRTIARSEGDSDDAYVAKVRDLVRERMHMNARALKGPLLVDMQGVRVDLLRAARKAGPAQCMAFVRTRRLAADVRLADPVAESERKLARRMLDARQLGPPPRSATSTTSVSGAIVGKVIHVTGLPDERVRQAMNAKGSDADQCAVAIALIDAALAAPDAQRQAILSVL
ncbi:MAG: hypothetical protein C0409_07635 [Novosphingobium sp.]|nr:hypothetical protein [Novosphingobium sp.]